MRDILTSPRIEDMKRRRSKYRLRLSILIFILLVSFVGALAYLSSYRSVTLHKVTVTGTRIINATDVEDKVIEQLRGHYIYVFSKSNSFIYPKKHIYKTLLKEFPRIATLSIYKDNINAIHIAITERAGSYLYCGTSLPQTQSDVGDNCYFVNNDGYIFDKAPYFSGNVYFKYYIDMSTDNPLGQQMLQAEHFHSLVRFIDGIIELGFKATHLEIASDGIHNIYLDHALLDTNPKIVFKEDDDLDIILENLSLSMKKPEFADEINSKYTTLQYIDLRFKNKVLYKFQ